MARALKAKKLAQLAINREGAVYWLKVEDDAGKRVLFEITSAQALRLADTLDNLLADEEEEQRPKGSPTHALPSTQDGSGTVKWYNVTKGFGFITPDSGGEELFLHRSVLEQAGITHLPEGTRVRIQIVEGKKGPQVSMVALV